MDQNKLWNDILGSIKVSVSPAIFTTWFAQTHLSKITETDSRFLIEVGCNSPYVKSTIEERYFGLLQDSLTKTLGKTCDISFIIKSQPISNTNHFSSPLFQQTSVDSNSVAQSLQKAGIRPTFNFDNFAVSTSNQMAFAAADAVSKSLGSAYNPLFIWGGVGIGKTHLMSAVGHKLLSDNPELNVISATGEQFTNDIVEGIRNKSTAMVRNKYRKLSLLLIDDIQFIAGKDAVQEEFFHTFNALVGSGSQIIMTSDRPPSEISKLEERLRSRFEAGLIVDIAPPDFELRCAITQIKAKQRDLDIPMDIIQIIAGNLTAPRLIEGLLIKLYSEIKLKNQTISPGLVENLLQKNDGVTELKLKAKPTEIIKAVARYYSLGKRQLLSNTRARPVARPRQILMYLLRRELELPLDEVGRLIGRDHTTVMHAVDKVTQLASSDVKTREDIAGIKSQV
jgi:chromosomal replication initiator protein